MKCKSCGANIEWVTTENGKKIPVNINCIPAVEDPTGNINGVTYDGKVIKCRAVMAGTEGSIKVRISHFATCPQANQWRK